MTDPILHVSKLTTEFPAKRGWLQAVRGVSFDVGHGETVGIVGESGSGKSAAMLSLLGLAGGARVSGQAQFKGKDLVSLSDRQMRGIRGAQIGMIFQDPMSSLNPVMTVGSQISETLIEHNESMRGGAAKNRAIDLLEQVGVPEPGLRYEQFPHEYSGGMRQRAMIAIAIANGPNLLIADEPTTALDVTIQAQVLDVLRDAKDKAGAATILISHDLGVIAEMADRVLVMYGGRIVESGSVEDVFLRPSHPYTHGLLNSIPRIDGGDNELVQIPGQPPSLASPPSGCSFHPRCPVASGQQGCAEEVPALHHVGLGHLSACHFSEEARKLTSTAWKATPEIAPALTSGLDDEPRSSGSASVRGRARMAEVRAAKDVVRVEALHVRYEGRKRLLGVNDPPVRAVNGVDLVLHAGETLGLVGESGCGKSTIGRAMVRLVSVHSGGVRLEGQDITSLSPRRVRPLRKDLQFVFQDPQSSLDPRMTVSDQIMEPLYIHKLASNSERTRLAELLDMVGLASEHGQRYPHELSGGQRQRVGIARALATEPKAIVLDEPVSALDVSIQAQIVNLLKEVQAKLGLAYLFIAHDLSVVRNISHRIAVMYLGKIVEIGSSETVFSDARHPYTRSLLSAVPSPVPGVDRSARIILSGDVPNPAAPPSGCFFHTRCYKAEPRCSNESPVLEEEGGRSFACFYPDDGQSSLPLTQEAVN